MRRITLWQEGGEKEASNPTEALPGKGPFSMSTAIGLILRLPVKGFVLRK